MVAVVVVAVEGPCSGLALGHVETPERPAHHQIREVGVIGIRRKTPPYFV